jgi:hypothetical protein
MGKWRTRTAPKGVTRARAQAERSKWANRAQFVQGGGVLPGWAPYAVELPADTYEKSAKRARNLPTAMGPMRGGGRVRGH